MMDAAEAMDGSGTDQGAGTIGPYLRRYGIYIFLISFLCVYYVSNGELMLGHYDLGWHLAAGDVIRQQGHVPLHDPWSFTAADKQWFNLSWLWDVIASLVFQYTGFGGIIFMAVATGAAIAFYLATLCLRYGASTASVGIAVFAVCLLYPAFGAAPNIYLAASPNIATMLFAVLFYGECLKRSRWLLAFPAVMVLWANLHGGFLLGFFVIGVFGGVALLRRDWAGVRMFALVGAACLVATLINPLGWGLYEGSAATLGHFVQANITEWQSYYQNMEMPESIPGMVYMLLFVALELRFFKNACPVEARLLSWLFLLLGIYQFRYMSFFFLFSTVPLALHLDRLLRHGWTISRSRMPWPRRASWACAPCPGLRAGKAVVDASAHDLGAGCPLSADALAASAAAQSLECRRAPDLLHPWQRTPVRRWPRRHRLSGQPAARLFPAGRMGSG
ncbi:MAG: hypothetical protein QM737_23840 [Ferruginibacter sp.]